MVDCQEEHVESHRKLNGRAKKRKLLHTLEGEPIVLATDSGEIKGKLQYYCDIYGALHGFYVGRRHVPISEVHRVYTAQNRIELYGSQRGVVSS